MHRIFILDDEEGIISVLSEYFSSKGFDITSTSDPAKALELLASDLKIDLMIMDMKMPKLRGTDVLREMQKMNRTMPVIILTGSISERKHKKEIEGLGYILYDICVKPVELNVLLNLVEKNLCIQSS